jgi:hypothetical protein
VGASTGTPVGALVTGGAKTIPGSAIENATLSVVKDMKSISDGTLHSG